MSKSDKPIKQNGKLALPVDFDDAVKAALETKPPPGEKPAAKQRKVRRAPDG